MSKSQGGGKGLGKRKRKPRVVADEEDEGLPDDSDQEDDEGPPDDSDKEDDDDAQPFASGTKSDFVS